MNFCGNSPLNSLHPSIKSHLQIRRKEMHILIQYNKKLGPRGIHGMTTCYTQLALKQWLHSQQSYPEIWAVKKRQRDRKTICMYACVSEWLHICMHASLHTYHKMREKKRHWLLMSFHKTFYNETEEKITKNIFETHPFPPRHITTHIHEAVYV